ncbi:MAG: BtrH N-terminal domain-containing protein [Anaerolineae bacterium]|nr:BtrH N-terminal domain-containing protein [Anaerolineae bacterium]
MPLLANYKQFNGTQWETGVVTNALAYQGVLAPHNGKPFSEALLFGISGGIVAGYFVFEYRGYEPRLHFLTRNTFDPMGMIFERLGIEVTEKRTASPEKAVTNLTDVLFEGKPAIVWADAASFEYNNLDFDEAMWAMMPVLVFGYNENIGQAQIADRARVALTVSAASLAQARARTASNKNRLITLDAADSSKLPQAVEAGIRSCIEMFTGEPPRAPMKGKFGLDAFVRWADLLTDTKNKKGWAKQFAPGERMYAGLLSAYETIELWGTGGNGARGLYADFMNEAAAVLAKPALKTVAKMFRNSQDLWKGLTEALLPDSVDLFRETRELMQREFELFMQSGGESLEKRREIKVRLGELKYMAAEHFPLSEAESAALREELGERVLKIHAVEREAVETLGEIME